MRHALGGVLLTLAAAASAPAAGPEPPGPPQEVRGILEVLIMEDFDRSRAEMAYFVRNEHANHLLELRFTGTPPPHLETGQRVTIRGRAQGKTLWVESLSEEPDAAKAPAAPAALGAAAAVEERRAILLLVDLIDAKASSWYTPEQVASNMWTGTRSVDGLYRDASLDRLTFPADTNGDLAPDVFGPFPIDHTAAGCNFTDWAAAADAAAQSAGIDLSPYRHRVYVLSNWRDLPDCSWAGVANVGCGTYCRVWTAEAESPMVLAHELGHNLSMAHAGTDPENDGQMNAEYGDYSDAMGLSRKWHRFNAPHIDQMGWYAHSPNSTLTVASGGTYAIAAIGVDPTLTPHPHLLKIAKPDTSEVYYLSYRQPAGYDDSLASTYTEGTSIHRYRGSGYGYTYFITALTDLTAFSDATNEISVTQLGHNGAYATVQIAFGPTAPICGNGIPTVTVSPPSRTAQPLGLVTHEVSVTNNDTDACPATTFDLTYAGAPSGWLTVPELTLLSGETGTATLQIDTLSIVDGAYPFEVHASDNDGREPHHPIAGMGSGAIIVDGSAPSVPTGLAGTVDPSGAVQLTWSPSNDLLSGIGHYTIYRNGMAIGQTPTTQYSDSAAVAGATYAYAVAATDAAGNSSEPSNPITLTIPEPDLAAHVADLDGSGLNEGRTWTARVTITLHDAAHQPMAGASISGTWRGGASGSATCTSAANGACTITATGMRKNIGSVLFTIDAVSHTALRYAPEANHDPDGDSDGTRIIVAKP